MKKILTTIALILPFLYINAAKKQVPTPAQQLLQRLIKIQKKGYMYGHQDDPFYGITWEWDSNRSDTYELVEDFPAVMGFDIGGIEMGDKKNLDSVPFQRIREEIIRHHERGGIITISWHPRNPLIGTTAWIGSDTTAYNDAIVALEKVKRSDLAKQIEDPRLTVKSIVIGGKNHAKYCKWLERVTTFLLSLKDNNGRRIPFIFRPFHENNGSWFWWGQDLCSDKEYHALWNLTQNYISSALPKSILWSYSPNLQGNWTEDAWMRRYPGDDRVDIIGEDAYQWGSEEDFKRQLNADMQLITKIAKQHGKLVAITECGYQNSPDATWWTRVLKPIIEKYPVSYILPWRNYTKEHFGASKDARTADDFKSWAKNKHFLFIKDIKKVK